MTDQEQLVELIKGGYGPNAGTVPELLAAAIAQRVLAAGWRPPTPAKPDDRTAFGQNPDPAKRAGLVAQVVHSIRPEQFAEHGIPVLGAWCTQVLRDLATNGARPEKDATIMFVGMADGAIIITGEARV